jgi:hypothetical protein
MTVKELIEILQKHPQDLQVARGLFSEYCIVVEADISVGVECEQRPYGWVPLRRPDKPLQTYLLIRGN